MSSLDSVKTAMQTAIDKANAKTGGSDTNVTDAINTLIDGYGKGDGITPSGTFNISANGTYDVTNYASAAVNVPASGITPSGSLSIAENGTFDVTNYASAVVSVPGVNVKLYNVTRSADATSGTVTLLTNDWLKSLRSNANGFVLMRYLGAAASTAMVSFWFTANFKFYYSGATGYNSVIGRSTASAGNLNANVNGLPGDNYNCHLNINSSGGLWVIPNATYPLKAGNYQIIAGTFETV